MHGDVIYAFLRHLAVSFVNSYEIKVLTTQFVTTVLSRRKASYILSNVIENKEQFFRSHIILIPFHHECVQGISHWSMISIFPKQKLIVHCDSASDEDRDRLAYEAMDMFLKKALS